jgi:hypothetical protein
VLVTGPRAGWHELEEDVLDWKGSALFVAREDLTETMYETLGLGHPESFASEEHVQLRRLLARAPILKIDPARVDALRGLDARVFRVGYTRNSDDWLDFHASRAGSTRCAIGASFGWIQDTASEQLDLEPLPLHAALGRKRGALDVVHLMDRVLRAASDGLVDGASIGLALVIEAWTKRLRFHPTPDEMDRGLAEIVARSVGTESDCHSIAAAIAAAPLDVDLIALPSYGSASRRRNPPLVLETPAGVDPRGASPGVERREHDGALLHVLVLPADDEWEIDPVEDWTPPAWRARRGAAAAEIEANSDRDRPTTLSPFARALLFAVVLFALVLVVLTRGAH